MLPITLREPLVPPSRRRLGPQYFPSAGGAFRDVRKKVLLWNEKICYGRYSNVDRRYAGSTMRDGGTIGAPPLAASTSGVSGGHGIPPRLAQMFRRPRLKIENPRPVNFREELRAQKFAPPYYNGPDFVPIPRRAPRLDGSDSFHIRPLKGLNWGNESTRGLAGWQGSSFTRPDAVKVYPSKLLRKELPRGRPRRPVGQLHHAYMYDLVLIVVSHQTNWTPQKHCFHS